MVVHFFDKADVVFSIGSSCLKETYTSHIPNPENKVVIQSAIDERDINSDNSPLLDNQTQKNITINSLNWNGLNTLITAANKNNFDERIDLILHGAKQIINADVLAIYLADNVKPGATLFTAAQNSSQLPNYIPIHDIIALREPYTWLPTQSPGTSFF